MIGRHLAARLRAAGHRVREFDIRNDRREDIRDRHALARALRGVSGVVHLAAVSRVAWGERDPGLCLDTNVTALATLVELCTGGSKPWLVFASSREVYGSTALLPVTEDAPLRPANAYGRSKMAGEAIVLAAREAGLTANICRLANVFGCACDHHDRVAMAFAGTAARGGTMRVTGGDGIFDFTAIEDVVDGLCRLIDATAQGKQLDPIHFASGTGTSLRALAEMAARHARLPVSIVELPPRGFDVSGFVGNPARASELLGWRAQAVLEARMAKLVAALARREAPFL